MNIFVAGATGAVGLPLARALCTQGHQVTGMTRSGAGVDRLREIGGFYLDAPPGSLADETAPACITSSTMIRFPLLNGFRRLPVGLTRPSRRV